MIPLRDSGKRPVFSLREYQRRGQFYVPLILVMPQIPHALRFGVVPLKGIQVSGVSDQVSRGDSQFRVFSFRFRISSFGFQRRRGQVPGCGMRGAGYGMHLRGAKFVGRSNAEVLTLGQEDIKRNWQTYRMRYEEEMRK